MRNIVHSKWLPVILITIIGICLCACASAETRSGTCGDNLTWTMDDTGTLTISGSGAMTDRSWFMTISSYSIKSVVIEDGITAICNSAFSDCTAIKSVTIPNSVTSIGPWAFARCTNLGAIELPQDLSSIDNNAFRGCTSLKELTLPLSITTLGQLVFADCSGLTTVRMEARAADINFPSVFAGCPGITEISIPSDHRLYSSQDGVVFNKSKDKLLYYPRNKQGSYSIPNGVKSVYTEAFEDCTGLTGITIPNSVTVLDWDAFRGCTGLTSVTIPENVEIINSGCFMGCTNLKTVEIPHTLTGIWREAFKDCALEEVTLYRKITTLQNNVFDANVKIHAPEGSYAAEWAYDHYYQLETFEPEYYITVHCNDDLGTVSASPTYGTKGTEVILTATPKAGYELEEWVYDANRITITNNKFTIGTSDVDIYGHFIEEQAENDPKPQQQEQLQPQDEIELEVPATIKLSKTNLTIKDGKAQTITATLGNPYDTVASMELSSGSIVTAKSNGKDITITPKSKGKVTIIVTTAMGAAEKLTVTVKEGWSLNEKKITLKPKKTFKIKVQAIPSTVKAKTFKSDKPAVATVDAKGKVKALKKGKATITVTLTNGKTLKLKVTVK